jgi:hypothetical protein
MKQTNPRTVRDAMKSINGTYKFMLDRGYEVSSVEDYDLGWQTVLRKQDVLAKIIRSRGEEEIFFRTSTKSFDEFTDIGSVIYAATGDKVPRWESSEPKVIERYLDKIETYLEGEPGRNKDGFRAAQKEYSAAFAPGAVAVPPQPVATPEPKKKPFLYYPLMVIIILLILGALTTLGLVLVDRLFSPF